MPSILLFKKKGSRSTPRHEHKSGYDHDGGIKVNNSKNFGSREEIKIVKKIQRQR